MLFRVFLSVILVLNLIGCAGCATTQKKTELQQHTEQLQTRVSDLEKELQQKDEEVSRLERDLEKSQKTQTSAKRLESRGEITPKNIQTALKNANLYDGPIDGKAGKNTKKSIKEFQRLNGLTPDGIVGKRTWVKLSEFLY
jgi:peptidoglycan hydrolase-like protein with peptidoglycan-binding domain